MKTPSPGRRSRHGLQLAATEGAYAGQSATVLAGILESVEDLFAAVDADLRFVAFNAAFRRECTALFGNAPALGQSMKEDLARLPEAAVLGDLVERAFSGDAFALVHDFTDTQKQRRFYEINVTPVLDTASKPVVVALVARDVTEKRDAERKFRQLLEASPDAMLITHGGVIEHINTQAELLFGYPPKALLGRPLEILVPQQQRELDLHQRHEYEKTPAIRAMGSGLQLRAVRANGTELPVEVNLSPLTVAGKTMVVAAIRDVSERARIEEKLRAEVDDLRASVMDLAARLQGRRLRDRAAEHLSEQHRSVFEHGGAGIVVTTTDGRVLQANDWFCNTTGYSQEELPQLTIHDITHPDDVDVDLLMNGKMAAGMISSYTLEKRLVRKDGSLIWVALAASVKRDPAGIAQHFVFVTSDISKRKETEQKLTDAHFRLRVAAEIGRLGFWEYDTVTRDSYFSPEWRAQAGYREGEIPASLDEWSGRMHPDDRERVLGMLHRFIEAPQGELQFEYRFRHSDGTFRWFLSRIVALTDPAGKTRKVVGVRLDITDRKDIEWAIRQEGQHDTLTGLPNRRLLYEYGGHILATAVRSGTPGAIVFIDLDHFKEVNDTYGHEAGDMLLKEIAQRLLASIRKGDIAGRLGGDEFIVILPHVDDAKSAASIAEHLLARLKKPHYYGEVELAVTPSIGVALFPDGHDDMDALVRKADHAMYVAKERGRSRVQVFTPELARRAEDGVPRENRLKAALKRGEFELVYQPIVRTRDDAVIGVEALLRWHPHPDKVVTPSEFISLAESIGLIGELGEWVFRTAFAQQAQWQREGMPALRVAVNVSAVQFRDKGFVPMLERLLHESGIEPGMVQLELDGSTVTQDVDKAIAVIQGARKTGVRVAIDHLGTGGCDLGSLSRLPADVFKINASFVGSPEDGTRSEAVAHAAVALGHRLDLEVVAEGIESEQALDCVRRQACGLVQGFHLGRPMPARELAHWFRARA